MDVIENINKRNDEMYFTDYDSWMLKKVKFGASKLRDKDYSLFLGEGCAGQIQYGNRTLLCDFIDTLQEDSVEV